MALGAKGVAPAAASASRRWRFSWGAAFCFGSRRESGEEATPRERWSRRRKHRTVPVVDEDLVLGKADRDVMRRGADDGNEPRKKGLRLQGCCFLAPARTPGRKNSTVDSGSGRSTHDKKQRQPEHAEQKQQPPRSPPGDPAPSPIHGIRTRRPEQPRGAPAATRARAPSKPPRPKASSSAGVGAFGPVVGLSVVAAVSMAGLLGGRLWAVACVCVWLAALSGIREAGSGTAGWDRRR